MKWIQGQSLAHLLRGGSLSRSLALSIGLQAADALQHAHEAGVLHRDLKPANILLNDKNSAFLVDFGVALVLSSDPEDIHDEVAGTLHYMAPEAVLGSSSVRSDLYSLGAVLYEMLVGERCFDGDDKAALLWSIQELDPPALSDASGILARELRALLRGLLAKAPENRPDSARAVASSLASLVEESQTPLRPRPDPGPSLEDAFEGLEAAFERLTATMEREDALPLDVLLEQVSTFLTRGGALLEVLESTNLPRASPEVQGAAQSLCQAAEWIEGELRKRASSTSPNPALEGVILRIDQSLSNPARSVLRGASDRCEAEAPGDFFDLEPEVAPGPPRSEDWLDKALSGDELRENEAAWAVSVDPQAFLGSLRHSDGDTAIHLWQVMWRHVDTVLLQGRRSVRPIFEAAVSSIEEDGLRERWSRLFSLFSKPGGSYWDPELVRHFMGECSVEDRRVYGRCLIFHPWDAYRQLALDLLEPPDFWQVILHPSTPVAWLHALWRHLREKVSRDYLKVFLVSLEDQLLPSGRSDRVLDTVELVKDFYEVDCFHEDLYFRILLRLDNDLRNRTRELNYRVDLDAEYVQRFRGFLSRGSRQDQPISKWKPVPLPIQRRLAWKGCFLKHFACHPVTPIAMECLPHLLRRDSVIDYISIPSINGRLLMELAKEKRFFRDEHGRYALVSNPKTPAFIVMQHIGYLRRDNLKKLAAALDANQLARTFAQRRLDQRG